MYDTRTSRSANARRWKEIDRRAQASLTDFESQKISNGASIKSRGKGSTDAQFDEELEKRYKLLSEIEDFKPSTNSIEFKSERV